MCAHVERNMLPLLYCTLCIPFSSKPHSCDVACGCNVLDQTGESGRATPHKTTQLSSRFPDLTSRRRLDQLLLLAQLLRQAQLV